MTSSPRTPGRRTWRNSTRVHGIGDTDRPTTPDPLDLPAITAWTRTNLVAREAYHREQDSTRKARR